MGGWVDGWVDGWHWKSFLVYPLGIEFPHSLYMTVTTGRMARSLHSPHLWGRPSTVRIRNRDDGPWQQQVVASVGLKLLPRQVFCLQSDPVITMNFAWPQWLWVMGGRHRNTPEGCSILCHPCTINRKLTMEHIRRDAKTNHAWLLPTFKLSLSVASKSFDPWQTHLKGFIPLA